MNREELKEYLPHREPMLLVDEVEIDEEGVAHAKYRIREDEFFCRGHFPGNPIVPGVIQCEIMAQSCVLLVKDEVQGKTTLYTGINNVKFKNIVRNHGETDRQKRKYLLHRSFAESEWQALLPRRPLIRSGIVCRTDESAKKGD